MRHFHLSIGMSLLCVTGLLAGCKSKPEPIPTADLSTIFQKTLIVGASISANYNNVASPGLKVAEKFGKSQQVDQIARNGARSSEIISQVEAKDLAAYSSIVALDLFFWDSVEVGCDNGVANIQKIIGLAGAAPIKLILGNVPRMEKIPFQPCKRTLNSILEDHCVHENNCYLIPLEDLYETLSSQGSIDFLNRAWTKSELLPDGLHLSPTGSEYIAEQILRNLN